MYNIHPTDFLMFSFAREVSQSKVLFQCPRTSLSFFSFCHPERSEESHRPNQSEEILKFQRFDEPKNGVRCLSDGESPFAIHHFAIELVITHECRLAAHHYHL